MVTKKPAPKLRVRKLKKTKKLRTRARKFTKFTIAEDIRRYLKKMGLICPKCMVIIPEGGYHYEPRDYEGDEIHWSGNFEVFENMDDIVAYGSFVALVPYPANSRSDYSLEIQYKKKDYYIFEG